MMSRLCSAVAVLLTLVPLTQSLPAPRGNLAVRALLGSSFGTPGNQTFDYVVVGGGNGGLAIAARLAEDPSVSVAVVEAGSFYEIDNGNTSQIPAFDVYYTGKDPEDVNLLIDWGFVTTPQAGVLNAKVHYARGKCLGGSTARNYMAYQRGSNQSYQMWADMVGDQSYTFNALLPFFEKSLDFTPPDPSKRAANATPDYDVSTLGTGGPLSVTFSNYAHAFSSYVQKGLQEIGIPPIKGFTSGNLIGSAYVLETINGANQNRESSETAFLEPLLKKSTNLIVFQSTLGKKILFDANQVATGVQVDSAGLGYTLSAKKEVILSAGAFQSPQLLMVSGVGPAAALQKHNIPVVADRPGVGQNMWDHVLVAPSYRVNVITDSQLANPAFALQAAADFNNDQSGILTNPGGDFLAWEKIPKNLRSNFTSSVKAFLAKFPADWPEVEYLAISGYLGYQENSVRDAPNDGNSYASLAAALVAPLSRGTIGISSADTADPPVINPNWLTDPTDVAVAIAGFKRARQLFASDAMKPVLIGDEVFPGKEVDSDAEILDIIQKSFQTVWHPAATCAMGKATDPNAVVDSKARVIGVKGLRVVDASAFPFLPPGHPMATIYCLAEKIANDIKTGN